MALRFRRSVRLMPGLRLNVGKRGVSLSAGGRGASMTFGKRGTYTNFGVRGTGMSVRQRVGGSSARRQQLKQEDTETVKLSIDIHLDDEGNVTFLDSDGNSLPEDLVWQAKRQKGDSIRQWLSDECDKINQQLRALESIHHDTPGPDLKPIYAPKAFAVPEAVAPTPKPLGILGYLFRRVRARIERENAEAQAEYAQELEDWRRAKAAFDAHERQQKQLVEERVYTDTEAMSQVLEERLRAISWPRETNVSFEVADSGQQVLIDVDLPEIEGMPGKSASLPARGWKVSMKALTDTKKRQLYMTHVHGIGFRLIGEAFANLPTANEVVLSGYSQRPNKATGDIQDEYLYSVRAERGVWSRINFYNLKSVDLVDALAQFVLRRSMTKTGIFKPVEPYSLSSQ